uniref:Lipocalin/cytosolic fatty-acid binding domain-containing protein n=1 Tax=Alexandrium catenella TaxID=2925 RepID=A0A7S1L529_ALECA
MSAAPRPLASLLALAWLVAARASPGACPAGSSECSTSTAAVALSVDSSSQEPNSLSLLQDGLRKGTGAGLSAAAHRGGEAGLSKARKQGGEATLLAASQRGSENASLSSSSSGNSSFPPRGCPPPGLKPAANFNVTEWIRKSWYAIQQVPVVFQPNPLLCVTATYDLANPLQTIFNVPGFFGDIVLVDNWQLQSSARLCGSVVDPSRPSAIKVAPCFLPFPQVLAGDYWVVHFEANRDGTYRWGLVSSGPPEEKAADGGCVNPRGTWIFSRTPEMAERDLGKARALLRKLGYSLSNLVDVKQAGCTYKGANLK